MKGKRKAPQVRGTGDSGESYHMKQTITIKDSSGKEVDPSRLTIPEGHPVYLILMEEK